ncbi:MAG TPA: SUF system NifU family Fe-S cluster assembly protein [Gammaproteobacteria bacterium]|nr:SUF system NifU family Fe-S cluster assembly protein [Gammaproteobacteria bacterium]
MSELHELYQEVIIDHGRRPRNFGVTSTANCVLEGFNPLCGDRLTVYLTEDKGVVTDATFQGTGCAISMASASLMTEAIKGKTLDEVQRIFQRFHQLVTGGETAEVEQLGKLSVLAGVAAYPARVKCATLAWHTMMSALRHE